MKRTKISVLVGLVLMVGSASGCQNFLEDASLPQGTLDELTLANAAGLEGTLIGAYRMLGGQSNWGSAPSNWALFSVTSDDAYKGTEAADQPAINPLEIYQWNVNHGYPNEKWNAVYEGAQRANATLRLLDRVQTERPGELGEAQARSIRGEALFLRAHFHFEAYRVFKNVPYYTDADPVTEFRKPKLDATQVLQNIIWDLDDEVGGNVQHIAEHGLTKEEVEDVLLDEDIILARSRSSGQPLAIGYTATGRRIAVVFEEIDQMTVRPITAYEVDD
jgi:uncharacterized DUF497 family protein